MTIRQLTADSYWVSKNQYTFVLDESWWCGFLRRVEYPHPATNRKDLSRIVYEN